MKNLLLIFKGFIVGLACIIPGVSGGTMAIIMGIYEKLIETISNILKKLKENFFFLLFLGIGIVLAILVGSKGLKLCLDNFLLSTILTFVGLVAGGVPFLYKQIKNKKNIANIIGFIVTMSLVIGLTFVNVNNHSSFDKINFVNILILIALGFVAAGTMIIPGISGSLVLMILGYYDFILSIVSSLTDFSKIGYNLTILGFFMVGCILGVFFFSFVINYCMKHFKDQTNSCILGFVLASIFSMLYQNFNGYSKSINGWFFFELIIGLILLFGAFILTYKLSKVDKNKVLQEDEKDDLEI